MPKGGKYDRCVKKVTAKGGNGYAVCSGLRPKKKKKK